MYKHTCRPPGIPPHRVPRVLLPPPTGSCTLAPVTGCLRARDLSLAGQAHPAAECSLTTLGPQLLQGDPCVPGGAPATQRGGLGCRKKQAGLPGCQARSLPSLAKRPIGPGSSPAPKAWSMQSSAHTLASCWVPAKLLHVRPGCLLQGSRSRSSKPPDATMLTDA